MCSSLPRQSDEPPLFTKFVSNEWQLRRCVCGHSFGCNGKNSAMCTRCGSSKSKIMAIVGDPSLLADAVSKANMPTEIANEFARKLQTIERKSANRPKNNGNSRSISIQAMHDATDDSGMLTIASLESELNKKGVTGHTPHQLIGQAEIEGILLRHGDESWTWLQQSS